MTELSDQSIEVICGTIGSVVLIVGIFAWLGWIEYLDSKRR